MAWNGSGTYSRTNGVNTGTQVWQDDAGAGTKILASRHDTHDQDLATGINACIAKNGENAFTGNADLGSNKLTNVAAGTTSSDGVRYDQVGLLAVANVFTATQTISGAGLELIVSATSSNPALRLRDSSTNRALAYWDRGNDMLRLVMYDTDGSTARSEVQMTETGLLHYESSGTVIASITADGITFNGDTAAANALDDYDEGTWTPVLSDGTNNATMSVQVGTYTKIGRQVHVKCRVSVSSLGSVSGNIRITGLPFTADNVTNTYGVAVAGWASSLSITAGQSVSGFIDANTTYITLNLWDSTGGTSSMQATEWTASGDVILHAIYYTAT